MKMTFRRFATDPRPCRVSTFALFGLSLLGLLLAGCGQDAHRRGELVLAISTDMNIDRDLDRVDVVVERDDGKVFNTPVDLYPRAGGLFTPGTYAVVEGNHEGESVRVSLVARRGSDSRVVRELYTTIPRRRVAMVPMPVQWLCEGDVAQSGRQSNCNDESSDGKNQTCNLGRCADADADAESLDDFDPEQLYDGYSSSLEAARAGACFDVVRCFDAGDPVDVDLDSCTFEPNPKFDNLNVGLVVEGDGHCNEVSGVCYIALDQSEDFGWTQADDGSVQLPPGACDRLNDGRVLAVLETGSCDTKTLETPACGPWLGPTGENDRDDDGIADSDDNCPDEDNPDQADKDGDGIGDACDFAETPIGGNDDRDNDGVPNKTDNCPSVDNADQADCDGNGVGDACQDCTSVITIDSPVDGETVNDRIFQVSGTVSDENVDEITIVTESTETDRVFSQTVPVDSGAFNSGNLILSTGENLVTAHTCTCSSEPIRLTSDVSPADILVTLTWAQNYSDVDLYVYEPLPDGSGDSGDVCYYAGACSSTESALGGVLDTDNTSGFGPENYSLSTQDTGATLAPGIYRIRVHYYSGSEPIDYSLRVLLNENSSDERVSTFSGTITTASGSNSTPTDTGEDWADVAEIECSGDPVSCEVRSLSSSGTDNGGSGGEGGTGGEGGAAGSGNADNGGTSGSAGTSNAGTSGTSEAGSSGASNAGSSTL